MFKIKSAVVAFTYLIASSAMAQTVLEIADQERAKKSDEVFDKASQPKPPSASEVQRQSGRIPLEEISLVGVQGVDGELRAELLSRAGATATLSLAGRRSFGGWTIADITPDYVIVSSSSSSKGSKHTIYLSAVRESQPTQLTPSVNPFGTSNPPPIPFPSPSL